MPLYIFMGYYLNTETTANLEETLSETGLNFERDVIENASRDII
jgi:hypothetical protein